jgi:hypothetical protein
LAEPVTCRLGDRDEVGDAPASSRDGHLALGRAEVYLVEGAVNLADHVGQRGGNELLFDPKEVHGSQITCGGEGQPDGSGSGTI